MAFIESKDKGDCPHCGRAVVFEFVNFKALGKYLEELRSAFITFKPAPDIAETGGGTAKPTGVLQNGYCPLQPSPTR